MLLCLQGPLLTQPGTGNIPLTRATADVIVFKGTRENQTTRNVFLMTFQEENSSLVPVNQQNREAAEKRDPEADMQCITTTLRQLELSGWYWGPLTASEAKQELNKMPEGTFLIRDSSHPCYLLTLSVKTNRGPTNVRIEYSNGKFCLDSYYLAKPRILAFSEVLSLIQHYVSSCIVDRYDKVADTADLPPKDTAIHLKLIKPLHRKDSFPSLQHLCRLTVNRITHQVDKLPLPKSVQGYLEEYPFLL
ncbi:cytokine-inducible SH2-containing protein-like [Scyliorhinus canicula]|uniref:cytokine-inducible SH2-containing protein-like n=1 Tax=Scyliorhinus canicula TaxID=7830 RepID=UPI0018F58235|nr:cytokine-inducible SH2-containing protein-like [Scyliorhinus canicula]